MIVHFLYKEYHATIFMYLIFRYLKHTAHYWHPKVHMKKWITIFTSLLISSCLYAQKPWTYQDCIDYALDNNLALKNVEYQVLRQDANSKRAYGNFLPDLNASTSVNISQGRTTNPNTNQIIDSDPFLSNSVGIRSNMTVFNGFRLQNQLKYEKFRQAAFQNDYQKAINDVTYLVMDAFIQHLINLGLATIQEEQLVASDKEVYRIQKRIDLGLASGSDLYEAEAQLASDEFLLIRMRNAANISENELKKLLNLPVDSTFVPEDIVVDPTAEPISVAQLDENPFDIQILPEMKSSVARLNAAQKQLSMNRAFGRPNLSAGIGWGSFFTETRTDTEGNVIPYNEQVNLNSNLSYGLSLSFPIFNKLNQWNNIQQSKISLAEAENNLRIMTRDTEYLINEALMDYYGVMAEYKSALKTEESRALAFEVIEKKREKGLASIMEFYQSKNDLATARGQSLRTRLQLFLNKKLIDFYLNGSF